MVDKVKSFDAAAAKKAADEAKKKADAEKALVAQQSLSSILTMSLTLCSRSTSRAGAGPACSSGEQGLGGNLHGRGPRPIPEQYLGAQHGEPLGHNGRGQCREAVDTVP